MDGSGARALGTPRKATPCRSSASTCWGASATPRGSRRPGTSDAKADDRRLDPQARAFLENEKKAGAAGFETMPVDEARKAFVGMVASWPDRREAVDKVEDRTVAGGPRIRVYTPAGPCPKPALVYFHGGGWVLGSPETIDVALPPARQRIGVRGCLGRLPFGTGAPFPQAA